MKWVLLVVCLSFITSVMAEPSEPLPDLPTPHLQPGQMSAPIPGVLMNGANLPAPSRMAQQADAANAQALQDSSSRPYASDQLKPNSDGVVLKGQTDTPLMQHQMALSRKLAQDIENTEKLANTPVPQVEMPPPVDFKKIKYEARQFVQSGAPVGEASLPPSDPVGDTVTAIDNFPAFNVFLIIATLLLIVFAIPAWRRLNSKTK